MGSLGIIQPPGSPGSIQQCNRLYFTPEFLSQPPFGATVQLPSKATAHAWLSTMPEFDTPTHHTLIDLGYHAVDTKSPDYTGWFLWPPGTVITMQFSIKGKVIWVLSGTYFPLTSTTAFEGKWPD
jgi:hypothetical protein